MSAALSFFIGTVVGTLAALLFAAVRERRFRRRYEAKLQVYRENFTKLLTLHIELRASVNARLDHPEADPADWWRES